MPSIDAKIIGELRHGDGGMNWTGVSEFYKDADGTLHEGTYEVKNGDYTWIPVEYCGDQGVTPSSEIKRGWVALEVVQLYVW